MADCPQRSNQQKHDSTRPLDFKRSSSTKKVKVDSGQVGHDDKQGPVVRRCCALLDFACITNSNQVSNWNFKRSTSRPRCSKGTPRLSAKRTVSLY